MTTAEPRPPEPAPSLSVGDVVADRYRIDAVLGEGGMGIVYRAEHLHLRKPFAIKVLLPEWSSMPEVVARFEREAIAAGNIQSPHVVAATDFGRLPSGAFFLAMEHVSGRTLTTVLAAGALAPARGLHVLRGIATALGAAHALGIVHRDLKPDNVMLIERDGDADFVKVLDFGVANFDAFAGGTRQSASNPLTQAGAIIGTPQYMSPEQALGQPIDKRSDLYSLGVIFFEMLTGSCPFEGDAVTVLRQRIVDDAPELPPALVATLHPRVTATVRRLLAKAPENRFGSAVELMEAIDECARAYEPPAPLVPARSSLESVYGMAMPVAKRLRQSVLSGVRALEGRGRFVAAAVALALVLVVTIVLLAGGSKQAPASTASPPATDSAAVVVPASNSADVPVSLLPPPPAPSSSAPAAGSPSSRSGRRTGPGGIYIPPPSQWFK